MRKKVNILYSSFVSVLDFGKVYLSFGMTRISTPKIRERSTTSAEERQLVVKSVREKECRENYLAFAHATYKYISISIYIAASTQRLWSATCDLCHHRDFGKICASQRE